MRITALELDDRICKNGLSDVQVRGTIYGTDRFGDHETASVVLDSLNGSAPRRRLRHLGLLDGIPFPGLIACTTFVCHWPFPTPGLENPSFRVYNTRSDGPLPPRYGKAPR
jgi:hypothetical protein